MQKRLKKYTEFLSALTKNLDGFFENQKDFIKCTAGCSHCCKAGHYPLTELEYEFVKIGFNKLGEEKQAQIRQSCLESYKERKLFVRNGNPINSFSYACPFLADDLCSLYEHRPLICRTHGLIARGLKGDRNFKLPGCLEIGLNYSEVWEKELKDFSLEKAVALNIKSHPEAFDIGYEMLLENFEHINFGDIRMLFEWVIMDIPNYQDILEDINNNLK